MCRAREPSASAVRPRVQSDRSAIDEQSSSDAMRASAQSALVRVHARVMYRKIVVGLRLRAYIVGSAERLHRSRTTIAPRARALARRANMHATRRLCSDTRGRQRALRVMRRGSPRHVTMQCRHRTVVCMRLSLCPLSTCAYASECVACRPAGVADIRSTADESREHMWTHGRAHIQCTLALTLTRISS